MADFFVRKMEEKDIEQVVAIEKDNFSMPWSGKSFLDAMQGKENIYLVCCTEAGNVCGYCGIWTGYGEGEITNVAVAKQYRRMGAANILLKHLEEAAKELNVEKMLLEVRESNEGAFALYSKFGFEVIGKRKNFYERPKEDAIIMSKNI